MYIIYISIPCVNKFCNKLSDKFHIDNYLTGFAGDFCSILHFKWYLLAKFALLRIFFYSFSLCYDLLFQSSFKNGINYERKVSEFCLFPVYCQGKSRGFWSIFVHLLQFATIVYWDCTAIVKKIIISLPFYWNLGSIVLKFCCAWENSNI